MYIKKYNKLLLLITCVFFIFQCKSDRVRDVDKKTKTSTENIIAPTKINKINFYFENSASMNGYLNGDDFRRSVGRILYNIEGDSLNSYFVNTNEYKIDNILQKIKGGISKIRTKGIGNSDHKFIFSNAIRNSANNNLSIVVTDGIYSMENSNLADVEIDIQYAFQGALKANEIETLVIKMKSLFKGNYYAESCKPGSKSIKINQERPYYIFLFGSKPILDKALKEFVVINDLEGYLEQARFMIAKDLNINYTVLTQGEEKQGEFQQTSRESIVKEIGDAEKFSKKGLLLKDSYLQFGIAVDFSKRAIPQSYLENISNYFIEDNTGYDITEIKKVDDLDKNSKSYRWIKKQNKKGKSKYTHIIVVRAKEKLYGDLSLSLEMNFPEWIKATGINNDCDIINDTSSTFAFDRLMIGISKAYKKVSKRENFFNIKIKIKAN